MSFQDEYAAARQRTGMTAQLNHAFRVYQWLIRLTPTEVEQVFRRSAERDSNTNFVDTVEVQRLQSI